MVKTCQKFGMVRASDDVGRLWKRAGGFQWWKRSRGLGWWKPLMMISERNMAQRNFMIQTFQKITQLHHHDNHFNKNKTVSAWSKKICEKPKQKLLGLVIESLNFDKHSALSVLTRLSTFMGLKWREVLIKMSIKPDLHVP